MTRPAYRVCGVGSKWKIKFLHCHAANHRCAAAPSVCSRRSLFFPVLPYGCRGSDVPRAQHITYSAHSRCMGIDSRHCTNKRRRPAATADPAEATAPQERALTACFLLVQHGDRLGRLGGDRLGRRVCVCYRRRKGRVEAVSCCVRSRASS